MSTMNRFALFLASLVPAVGGLWMATEKFAALVAYDPVFLGSSLIIGGTHIYPPWAFVTWYFRYQRYVPELFSTVTPYSFGGFVLCLLMLFLFRPEKKLTSHGSAHWASYKDLVKMQLISGSGVVVGLYDNPSIKKCTAFLHWLESKKDEAASYGEMNFDKKLDEDRDRKEMQLSQMKRKIQHVKKGSPAYKKLKNDIAKDEKWLSEIHSYTPCKYSLAAFWKALYDKTAAGYRKLSHFYLRDNDSRHIIVVAPTRSGKGVGLIIPTLLGGWKQSVVVNDIKSENWGITAGYRKRMGQKVIKFEPTSSDGSSARWNPLDEIPIGTAGEVSAAQNIANVIANYEGKENPDHWIANAGNVIAIVILHLEYAHYADPEHYPQRPNLYTVASFLKATLAPEVEEDGTIDDSHYVVQDFVKAIQALQNFPHVPEDGIEIEEWSTKDKAYVKRKFTPDDLHALYPDDFMEPLDPETAFTHPIINRGFMEIAKKPDNELGSIISTANTALKEYLDPVLTANTRVSDFCIDDLMRYDRPVSLYLITPPSDLLRMSPIFRLFFEMMIGRHTREIGEYKKGRCSKPSYRHKCLLLMDEFNSLGNLKRFASALAFTAGYGMKSMLIMQGLDQLYKTYGKENELLMNTSLQIYYSPNDAATAKHIEESLGNETIRVESESETGSWFKKSVSYSETSRPLLTAEESRRLGNDEILFVQNNPPVRTEKIKYYEQDFFLKKLVDAPYVSDVIRSGGRADVINSNPLRKKRLDQRKEAGEQQFKDLKVAR